MMNAEKSIESVLFVCWGNVCRSPAAELIFKREMKRRGMGNVQIESAGVCADYEIAKPSFSMWWASLRRGFWLRPRPRLLRKRDFHRFDLVIAMDRDVLFSMSTIVKRLPHNVKLLSEFLPDGFPIDVPDPMRRSVPFCNRVLDMLEVACAAIGIQTVSIAASSQDSVVC